MSKLLSKENLLKYFWLIIRSGLVPNGHVEDLGTKDIVLLSNCSVNAPPESVGEGGTLLNVLREHT